MMTPATFMRGSIGAHEGVLSMRASDGGNYQGGKVGDGKLIGSQYGVTPPALALYKGVSRYSLTNADMRAITLDLAVDLGVALYYDLPHLGFLPWDQITASVMDKCWGSGQYWGVRLLQRTIGAVQDGICGGGTKKAYIDWKAKVGLEQGAKAYAATRLAYDASLPTYKLNPGWDPRTKSFLPGTAWWAKWSTPA